MRGTASPGRTDLKPQGLRYTLKLNFARKPNRRGTPRHDLASFELRTIPRTAAFNPSERQSQLSIISRSSAHSEILCVYLCVSACNCLALKIVSQGSNPVSRTIQREALTHDASQIDSQKFEMDDELREVCTRWPQIASQLKAAIMGIVRSAIP